MWKTQLIKERPYSVKLDLRDNISRMILYTFLNSSKLCTE